MPSSSPLLRSHSPLLRCYEKLLAEKTHRLIRREKLLEEARRRSEARDDVAPPTDSPGPSSPPDFAPATLKERVEALTVRFVRDVSEGLRSSPRAPQIGSDPDPPPPPPLDLRKLVGGRRRQ